MDFSLLQDKYKGN